MMTTVKHIITLALSKLGVAGGQKKPRAEDLALGLSTIQSLYRTLIETGSLGRSRNVVVSGDYMCRENDRVLRRAGATGDVTVPETIPVSCAVSAQLAEWGADYGAMLTPSTVRPPRNGAFIVINDAQSGNTQELIYDGYTNKWIGITDLTLDDQTEYRTHDGVLLETRTCVAPLSGNANGLAARLAVLLADHYSATPSGLTVRDADRFDKSLVMGFGEPRERVTGVYF